MSKSIKKIPSTGVYGQMFGEGGCPEWTLAHLEAFFKEHTRDNVAAIEYLHERADKINQQKIIYVANSGLWSILRPWDKTRSSLSYEVYLDTSNSALYVVIKGFTQRDIDFYNISNGIEVLLFGIDDVDGKISHVAGYEMIAYGKAKDESHRWLRPTPSICPLSWITLCDGQSPEISVTAARDFLKEHAGSVSTDANVWFEFFVGRAIESQSNILRCEGTGVKRPFDPDYDASFHEKMLRCELTFGRDEKTLRVSIKPFSDIAVKVALDRSVATVEYLFLNISKPTWKLGCLADEVEPGDVGFQPHPVINKIKWSPHLSVAMRVSKRRNYQLT